MPKKTVRKKPRLNKKFRFQLLQQWLVENYTPCKAADVGGGKGLLAYLLNQHGWETTVIDPVEEIYLTKYKNLDTTERIKLSEADVQNIPRINRPFEISMAEPFELLIGLHAHGSNMKIIQASHKFKKNFVLLPCCVIDEPIIKRPNVDWFESLVRHAEELGFDVQRAELNFKGQNQLIYTKYHAKT